VQAAVAAKTAIDTGVEGDPQEGTLHFSAADRTGTLVSVTLTHGGGFGSCVTVPGLGLTLGHGMTRFDPGTPNAVGPRKRPVHNMTPTLVCKNGVAVAAIGGQGGRKIPNGVADCLLGYVANKLSLVEALRAPRLHTLGDLKLQMEGSAEEVAWLCDAGYDVSDAHGYARISAAQYDPATGACTGASA
jgi:gamma-glutamyltranspeptidase / glutathione hydrolase